MGIQQPYGMAWEVRRRGHSSRTAEIEAPQKDGLRHGGLQQFVVMFVIVLVLVLVLVFVFLASSLFSALTLVGSTKKLQFCLCMTIYQAYGSYSHYIRSLEGILETYLSSFVNI